MIKVIHTRCQPWLYKNAKCRLCADACPIQDCVSFKENAVSVDNALCIGCGICANVCPTSALVFENLSDRELLQRLELCIAADDKDVVLSCSLGFKKDSRPTTHDSRPSINLPCLAILKESHLVSLILSGIKNIYLDAARCSGCSFKYGRETIEKTVSYANNLLNAAGYEDCIETGVRGQGSGVREDKKSILLSRKNKKQKIKTITPSPEYSRRELLHFFKTKAVDLSLNASIRDRVVGKSEKKGGGKKTENIPDRRAILLETINKWGNNISTAKVEHRNFPVSQIMITENCALCHDCSLFCPTGALTRIEGDGEIRIDFNMSLCMGCYECKELCPEGAISKQGDIDIKQMFNAEVKTMFKKETKICPSCGKTFFPEDDVNECIICRKKNDIDEIFFGALFKNPALQENKQTIGDDMKDYTDYKSRLHRLKQNSSFKSV